MDMLSIDPKKETEKITKFIKKILHKQEFKKVVIASSGGVDSTISLYLLRKVLEPKKIIVVNLPFFSIPSNVSKIASTLGIPKANIQIVSIKTIVDHFSKELKTKDLIRVGNIMARVRMIIIYDLAKKNNALVCGTENKSEHLLGYFTRFGDEASDFEPIKHLYKTQVYQLARYLKVPEFIIEQKPTAGLWHGQTDEEELGFSYKEADAVLYLHFDKNYSVKEITKMGYKNADEILDWVKKNRYKHRVPYSL